MSSGNGVAPVTFTRAECVAGAEYDIGQKIGQPSPAASTLTKAAELIDGDRDKQHGDRHECHAAIAALWSAFLTVNIEPADVALMLALQKIARTQHGEHNPDNYVDGCGYIAIAGELANVP